MPLLLLAAFALLMQAADGVSAARMILAHGPPAELNPLVRHAFVAGGPAGLLTVKAAMVVAVAVAVRASVRAGRPAPAWLCLALAAAAGAVGFLSNLG